MSDVKVLLGFQTQESLDKIKETLGSLNNVKYFDSRDGTDCLFKLSNSQPNILILEESLAKRSGSQVVDWVLTSGGNLDRIAIILISNASLLEGFEDAKSSGRLQVLSPEFDLTSFKLAFVQAFNFISGKSQQKFQIKLLSQGEVLIRQGERAEFVYLLQKGRLKAVHMEEGEERLLGEIDSGEFVGEMAYINQELRSATVIAQEESELVEIPIQYVDQILFQKPNWAKALMRTLSKRLKRTNELAPKT